MKKLLATALLSAGLVLGAPSASAAVILGTADVGATHTITFDGFSGSPAGTIAGLSATVEFTLTSVIGGDWLFSYEIVNTSGAPITASRLSNFGFNTTPDILASPASFVTGVFDTVEIGNNQPNQVGTVEVCFTASNCPGGGSGGVEFGDTGGGTFNLAFAGAPTEITLSNFFIRWQSIEGAGNITSASGLETGCEGPNCFDIPVPEPGTLLLFGAGVLGLAMRRHLFV